MAINISQLGFFQKIKVLLHTGEGKPGINHMNYWIPEFIKSGIEFAVLVRNEAVYKELSKKHKRVTILFATTPLEVEEVVNNIPTLQTIFYTSNTGNNIHLLRFIDYKHILIGTENSDRDSKVTKFMRAYDEIWVSSDAIKDKISSQIDTRHLALVKIGKPQLKSLLEDKRAKLNNTVLYLSSNEGANENENFSSLKILPYVFHDLGKNDIKFDFLLDKKIGHREKRYLNLQKELEESAYIQNIDIKFYNEATDDLLLKNKYIVCDIKTLSNKILASGAIIFLYIPDDKIIQNYTKDKYMSYDFLYTFSSPEELKELILKKDDEMKIVREDAIDYWLGKKETKQAVFLNQLNKLKG